MGWIIRLILADLPGFKIDVDAWFAWAVRINEVGFAQFYSNQIWTNYTPGYLYILGLMGLIRNTFDLNGSTFYFILKLPAILSELILGYLTYKFCQKYLSKKVSLYASILVLLNPGFIFNSAVWGQIDGLLTLLMVLAILYLKDGKIIVSSIFLGLAILIKPQALALVPIYVLYNLKSFSAKKIFFSLVPSLLIFLIFSLPFFPTQPIGGIVNLVKNMVNDYSYTSLFAYNLWGVVGFWINDLTGDILSYKNLGSVLLFTYWIFLSYFFLRRNLGLFSLSALATLGFFFLPTRVHERYLYPALVFLIFAAAETRNIKILLLQIILSLVYFLNIYYVYVYYNEFYLKLPQLLYINWLYNALEKFSKIISIFNSLIFVVTSFIIVKPYVKKDHQT